jgi:hypothetical protein
MTASGWIRAMAVLTAAASSASAVTGSAPSSATARDDGVERASAKTAFSASRRPQTALQIAFALSAPFRPLS